MVAGFRRIAFKLAMLAGPIDGRQQLSPA